MGWFKRDEEDFDDSSAFESDKGALLKMVLMIIMVVAVVGALVWLGYDQYEKYKPNGNGTNATDNTSILQEGDKIIVNFSTFNASVNVNPQGYYYYTTQEVVKGENCYIDNVKKSCGSLTENTCSRKECEKKLVTETECYVNNEKIECPNE